MVISIVKHEAKWEKEDVYEYQKNEARETNHQKTAHCPNTPHSDLLRIEWSIIFFCIHIIHIFYFF